MNKGIIRRPGQASFSQRFALNWVKVYLCFPVCKMVSFMGRSIIAGWFLKHVSHRKLYLAFLLLLAVSLPLSLFLLSAGMIGLALNWIAEGGFKFKWDKLKKNKALCFFLLLYPVHLLWMINSSDWLYGSHDLRIKLPLLVLPLVIGTSEYLSFKQVRLVLFAFMAGCFIASILAMLRYAGFISVSGTDVRNISGSLSHIRLALMINLAFFWLLWLYSKGSPASGRVLYLFPGCWFLLFIFFLKSLTGLVLLLLIGFILCWVSITALRNARYWRLARYGLLLIPLFLLLYVLRGIDRYFPESGPNAQLLEKYTNLGNPYVHDTVAGDVENGHYVWQYLCEEELRSVWNARASVKYDSLDHLGQSAKTTLIRYLTSKGLRKDQAGVKALTEEDIRRVESGMANYIFANRLGLYPYLYRVIWEIDVYRRGGNPSGHSITQRLEYSRAAWHIIGQNPIFGTGTGDVAASYKSAYKELQTSLSERWQLRAHNQYLTFLLSFGLVGFLLAAVALFAPVVILWRKLDMPDLVFILVVYLSMLNEDTLETHAGVSLVSFFLALLLFGRDKNLRT